MYRFRWSIVAVAILAACGGTDGSEDDENAEPDRFPALEEAEPLDLQTVELGTGVYHGAAVATAFFAPPIYQEVVGVVPNAFTYVQAYDEAAPVFGEYQVYPPPPEVDARMATDFIGMNASAARFENRAPDIVSELETATAEGGGDGWNSVGIVMDLWRLRRDWWVRWDGNLDNEANVRGKGPYGLNREDMTSDLLGQIESVAASQQPRYFIVGDEMGLLLATEQGEGLSMAEFSNFMWFFQEASSRIKEESPDTQVGVGFNWDHFVERIAPAYAKESDTSNLQVLDRAFQAVILPFVEQGDIVALKSYRAPDDGEIEFPVSNLTVKESYQFLRRLNALYETDAPIVYYSIGSPVDTPVGYLRQRNYLEAFVDWNAGVEPAMVAWRSMLNFDGTDTADQQIDGRCLAFTSDQRAFELPVTRCYDGLVDSVFSTKEPFAYLSGE